MRRLLLIFCLLLLAAAPPKVSAEDGGEQTSSLDQLDQAFGDYLVGPLASVLFWDMAFWDNSLPPGEGIGQLVGDEIVIAHRDGAYVLAKQTEVGLEDVTPILKEPYQRSLGVIKMSIRQEGSNLLGTVKPTPITLRPQDIKKLVPFDLFISKDGLKLVDEELDPAKVKISLLMAPFPVAVVELEEGTWSTAAFEMAAEKSWLPLSKGGQVLVEGQGAEIINIAGNRLTVQSAKTRSDASLELPNPNNLALPMIVVWLVFGAVFFTLRMRFINLRAFKHALEVTAGKFDDPSHVGEISHFQALSAALSATVGLGNIAGVALAVAAGGPGAIFWMIMAGFLGMSAKFTECTLGQMYRIVDKNGNISGGPMHYLKSGLTELGLGGLGAALSLLFSILCIGASFGGGNMFQANQSYQAVAQVVPFFQENPLAYGIILGLIVGVVIIGGVKRIGAAAGAIVPLMCGVYLLAGFWILLVNIDKLPTAIATIVGQAFTPEAGYGGLIGVLIQGFRRAAFSNEAGVGSASIAHSAATTEEPVREGIVALLEPFIDTIIVCTMTGLVVVITGAYEMDVGDGVLMTSKAFESAISWFPVVLTIAVVLFAFSTMISWSYYGERCWTNLFGHKTSIIYRIIFVLFVVFGSVINLKNVLDFSDLMILGMAFPNILGAILLSAKVRASLDDYWLRYKTGQMKRHS